MFKQNSSFFTEINVANLSVLRLVTGIAILWTYIDKYDYVMYLVEGSRYFVTYDFFHWIRPLQGPYMGKFFVFAGFVAICFALGIFYRFSLYLTFASFSYFFLLCQGHYNNHYYLFILILLLFMLTNVSSGVTILNMFNSSKKKEVYDEYWKLLLFKFQFFVVYFFAGTAKLNSDWLSAYPLKIWLYQKSFEHEGFIQSFFQHHLVAYSMSYIGLIFDLFVGFMLFSKKTRKIALLFIVVFHSLNFMIWDIGAFPFYALTATIIFFDPILGNYSSESKKNLSVPNKQIKIILFSFWVFVQLILPIRSHFFKGHVFYNGEGLKFSWRMKLYQTEGANKVTVFIPEDNAEFEIDIRQYVNLNQLMHMNINPTTFVRFCKYIEKSIKIENPNLNPEVRLQIWKSVNGRNLKLINDEKYNYALSKYSPFKAEKTFENFYLKTDTPRLYLNNERNWKDFDF